MVERHGVEANAATPVIKCANYLVKNGRWLHYDRALADGVPIATGVIEGACATARLPDWLYPCGRS